MIDWIAAIILLRINGLLVTQIILKTNTIDTISIEKGMVK